MTLLKAESNLKRFSEMLKIISGKWGVCQPEQLRYDDRHGIALTRNSKETIRRISTFPSRLKRHAYQTLCKSPQTLNIELTVPPDAVVIGPDRFRGPVIAAASTDSVLKFITHADHLLGKYENEVSALILAQEAELDSYLPLLYDSEYGTAGIGWLLMSLVPNDVWRLPASSAVAEKQWLRWLEDEGLKVLSRFYRASGIDEVPISEIRKAISDTAGSLSDDRVRNLALDLEEKLAPFDGVTFLECRIHGDLSQTHIHHSRGKWTIIDWGESERRPLFSEFLPFVAPPGRYRHEKASWDWLAGVAPASNRVEWFQRNESRWMNHFSREDELRAVILSYLMLFVVDAFAKYEGTRTTGMYPHIAKTETLISRAELLIKWFQTRLHFP